MGEAVFYAAFRLRRPKHSNNLYSREPSRLCMLEWSKAKDVLEFRITIKRRLIITNGVTNPLPPTLTLTETEIMDTYATQDQSCQRYFFLYAFDQIYV